MDIQFYCFACEPIEHCMCAWTVGVLYSRVRVAYGHVATADGVPSTGMVYSMVGVLYRYLCVYYSIYSIPPRLTLRCCHVVVAIFQSCLLFCKHRYFSVACGSSRLLDCTRVHLPCVLE